MENGKGMFFSERLGINFIILVHAMNIEYNTNIGSYRRKRGRYGKVHKTYHYLYRLTFVTRPANKK